MTAEERIRANEQNINFADLRVSADQVRTSMHAVQYAELEAKRTAKLVSEHFQAIKEGLEIVKAKKLLKIRLNATERALWTLYGKATKD